MFSFFFFFLDLVIALVCLIMFRFNFGPIFQHKPIKAIAILQVARSVAHASLGLLADQPHRHDCVHLCVMCV